MRLRLDRSERRLEEICVEARIMAVADTVAAMSSHRPDRSDRPAVGVGPALEVIERGRGS